MRIYSSLDDIAEAPESGRIVAIGVFDGVHRGHQRILSAAVENARQRKALSTAVTFYPHPEAVLHPRPAPRLLTSLVRKAQLLEALGLDEVVVIRFDLEFARLTPEAFCRLVLSHRLGARLVVVGENFRFGHQGMGTPADLRAYGATHDFETRSVGLTEEDGEVISSTRIRRLLGGGHVVEAARLLGRPHRIEGQVVKGAGRGRALEAPTANLAVDAETAMPRLGVYVTHSFLGGGVAHPSVTSVGTNPTFETDRKTRIETFLLEHSGDIYGSRMEVDFLERIRAQQTFPDAGSLAARIWRDAEIARRYFAGRTDT
jgi:riboflavin kinase/FMN adenylyltransferase